MATTIIKSSDSDNQALVDSTGHLYVTTGGGGGTPLDSNLIEVGGDPITLGQKTMANSLPVVIANDQSPIQVAGTVNTNLNGLTTFQTSQHTVGTSAVQLTPTPLTNRSSISIKAHTTSALDIVYIGNSNAVTSSTGYALFLGDSLQLDLTPAQQVWIIATSASQLVYVMEIGD